MPLTFPSHAAAIVPLKLWRPAWFDGVALVVGSAAPDFPYALQPYVTIRAHVWWALAWFCVPVTMAVASLIRSVAADVAGRLPGYWRDYAVLKTQTHPWYVTVACAYLAAVTHRLWDLVTHASIDQGNIRYAWLSDTAFAGQPWWRVLHYGSTVLGGIAVAFAIHHVGRNGLLRRWHPERPDESSNSPRVFWVVTGTVWAAGVALQPMLAGWHETQILFVRLLAVFAAGLVIAAVVARTSAARTVASFNATGQF